MSLRIRLIALFIIMFGFSFSQVKNEYPFLSVIDNDTVVIFDMKQAKDLIGINEQKKECLEINSVLNGEIVQKDTIIYSQTKKIQNLNAIIDDNKSIIKTKDNLIQICEDEKENLKKDVRKQKVGKWLSIVGIVTVGVLGIVF